MKQYELLLFFLQGAVGEEEGHGGILLLLL